MQFQLALKKTFCPTPPPLSTDDSSTAKKQKLPKQCFLLPPHWFSTQSSQYQYWKVSNYSILAVIELGLPVLESLTESQNFMPPLILNTNFIKRESKFATHRIHSLTHNHSTIQPLMRRVLSFTYPSIKSLTNPGDISLPWNCASVIKSHTHHSE